MSRHRVWHKASPLPLAIRLGWGALLLAAPGPVLRLMGGADEHRGAQRIVRVLGARHLLEGAAEHHFGGGARKVGVGVDLIHAATDVGFASIDARWRRAALTDAAIAGGFAILGLTNG